MNDDFNHSCKIGTIPMVIFKVSSRGGLKVGRPAKIQRQRGSKWERVIVNRVDDDGYFQADLM